MKALLLLTVLLPVSVTARTVTFDLRPGQSETRVVPIANDSDENRYLRIEPEVGDNRPLFAFRDRLAAGVEATPDSGNVVCVPAGTTKEILLTATAPAQAGTYRWSFGLVPVNVDIAEETVSVTLAVASKAFRSLSAEAPVAAGQLTRVNSGCVAEFRNYGLQVNDFTYAENRLYSAEDVLRVCESLDNSMLCLIGITGKERFRQVTEFLFGTEAIANAFDAFFRRGGLLFFEPGSWDGYNSWSGSASRYFSGRGVTLPTGANYRNPSSGADVTIYGTYLDNEGARLFSGPEAVGRPWAIRYFAGSAEEASEPYVRTTEGWTLLMGQTLDSGRVVFSLLYDVQRDVQSPFWNNAVSRLYGEGVLAKTASRRTYLNEAKALDRVGIYLREEPVFERLYATSPVPTGGDELEHLDVLLARGDRELAKLVFYNTTETNVHYRLVPDRSAPAGDLLGFLDVIPWRTERGKVQQEILVEPNGENVITVPSGEAKAVLLVLETDRPAGTYEGSFTFAPLEDGIPPRTVSVTAEVLDLAIEDDCLPLTYMYGPYNHAWAAGHIGNYRRFLNAGNRVALVQAGSGHWTKILSNDASGRAVVCGEAPEGLVADEISEKRAGRRWVNGYGLLDGFWTRMKALGHEAELSLSNEATLALFAEGVAMIDAEFRKAGITSDDFYEPLRDEPGPAEIPDFVLAAQVCRSHGWRICVDISTVPTMDDIRRLEPVIDFWQPWESRLTSRATSSDEIAWYRATGKTVMPYLCSMSGNTDSLLAYHRYRGIRSFSMGYDGFGTWAANSWRGNDWRGKDNDLGGVSGTFPGAWYVHHGDTAPVGTLRLEAWREGAEDYHWLKYAEKRGLTTGPADPRTLASVNASTDARTVKAWRDRLLRRLAGRAGGRHPVPTANPLGEDVMADAWAWWKRAADSTGNGTLSLSGSYPNARVAANDSRGVWLLDGRAADIGVTNQTVKCPVRGVTLRDEPCLRIASPQWTDDQGNVWHARSCIYQRVFSVTNASGYTLVTRYRLDGIPSGRAQLLGLGYLWGSNKGSAFILSTDGGGADNLAVNYWHGGGANVFARTQTGPSADRLRVGAWTDLALVVSNGYARLATAVEGGSGVVWQGPVYVGDCPANEAANLCLGLNGTTGTGKDAGASSAFTGVFHSTAIWPRRLSDDEVGRAMGWPAPDAFRIGLADGSVREFSPEATAVWTVPDNADFAAASPAELLPGTSYEVKFSIAADAAACERFLVLTSTAETDLASRLSVSVNDREVAKPSGGRRFAADRRGVLAVRVPAAFFRSGSNSLKVSSAGTGLVEIDFLGLLKDIGGFPVSGEQGLGVLIR